jgi:hypothetical protein
MSRVHRVERLSRGPPHSYQTAPTLRFPGMSRTRHAGGAYPGSSPDRYAESRDGAELLWQSERNYIVVKIPDICRARAASNSGKPVGKLVALAVLRRSKSTTRRIAKNRASPGALRVNAIAPYALARC